jgi:hypothetical protein
LRWVGIAAGAQGRKVRGRGGCKSEVGGAEAAAHSELRTSGETRKHTDIPV